MADTSMSGAGEVACRCGLQDSFRRAIEPNNLRGYRSNRVRAAWLVPLLLSVCCPVGGTSVPSHSLRHDVNIAGDPATVHSAPTMLEGLKGWMMAEVSPGMSSRSP